MNRPAGRVVLPMLLGLVVGLWFEVESYSWSPAVLTGLVCMCLSLSVTRARGLGTPALLLALGICGVLLASSVPAPAPMYRTASGFRFKTSDNHLCGRIQRIWNGREAALFSGILGGEPRSLGRPIKELFRRAGLSHLLAVSGLHVGIVGTVILRSCRSLNLSTRLAYGPILLVLPLYVLLLGWKISVVRAVIMGTLAAAGVLLRHRAERINSMWVAALVIILIEPGAVKTAAFQLSFAATFGIITSVPRPAVAGGKSKWRAAIAAIGEAFTVSVKAQMWALPVAAWHFKTIPMLAPLSNLLVLPLVFALVPAGYCCLALSLVSCPAARALGHLLVWPADCFFRLLGVLGDCPATVVSVECFNGAWLCVGYVVLLGTVSVNGTICRVSGWSFLLFWTGLLFLC